MSSDWAAKKAAELDAATRGCLVDELRLGVIATALREAGACGHMSGFDAARLRLAKETPTATVETPPGFRKQALRVHVGGISWWMDLPESFATALRDAARVPKGCVRTADGVDRKVLGTLPITADGCVVGAGEGSRTWTMTEDGVSSFACADGWYRHRYSTREAAEAALAQPTPARHQWFDSGMLKGVESCRVCGVVRQRDGRNDDKPCRGAVRVGPRSCTCNRNHVDDDEHAPTCGLNSTPARGEGE